MASDSSKTGQMAGGATGGPTTGASKGSAVADPDETRWLDERENKAWRTYLHAHDVLTARLGRQLQRGSDLSHADYGVLVFLSEAPDHRCRPYELAEMLQWEKSRLSHHLKRMEARGLVERAECPSDARGSFIAITDEGVRAITAAAPLHVADVRGLFLDALDDDQLDALTAINAAILAAVAAADAED
jgi:DNA-binding MarR family transcriptional regulator